MNLKIRLAFLYSLSVFIILVISGVAIYIFNENFRKEEFTKRLVSEAIKSGKLFFDVPIPTANILTELNQNAIHSLQDGSIFIFDSSLLLLYKSPGSSSPAIKKRFFYKARARQQYLFNIGNSEAVIIHGFQKGKSFYVLTFATDTFGNRKSENLKMILIASVLGGILLSGFLSFLYVRQAMKPLEDLKFQIEKINERSLKERIKIDKGNDEASQIAEKFNAMLDRIEMAFEQRKNFVHHASHELRTPLANMLAQTEAALNNKHGIGEYRRILHSLKEDQQDMIDLTNSLLELSRYEKAESAADWSEIRIDEILYETIDFVNHIWPHSVVIIDFETVPEDENYLVLRGNESLIRSAVQNLIKNAIQYSEDYKVKITISAEEKGIKLQFDNVGKQISAEEQPQLFIPFFRGENSVRKKGHGLGLSIVQRIIHVHKGSINYQSVPPDINRFTVLFNEA